MKQDVAEKIKEDVIKGGGIISKKRYIITDMDDTLIAAYGEPTPEIKELWNQLSLDENVVLIIATGQQYMKVKSVFLTNGLVLPDYIISDQGSVIYSTKENKILKSFSLPTKEVVQLYEEFLRLGGTDEFVRIYNPEMIFAYDCDIARKFFKDTKQRNVMYGKSLRHILENGEYTKVIMMNSNEKVDNLVLYSLNSNTLMAVNTGKTNYGECDYYRFESISSNKKIALEKLLSIDCDFPNNKDDIDIICLGDEKSDYGLAQVALSLNLYPNNSGKFAVVKTDTVGNKQLLEDSINLAKSVGLVDKVVAVPSVKLNGWKQAVEEWLAE